MVVHIASSLDMAISPRFNLLPPFFTVNFEVTPLPLNMTVEQGVAVFNCQHRTSDDITWRVIMNGTLTWHSANTSIEKVPLSRGG